MRAPSVSSDWTLPPPPILRSLAPLGHQTSRRNDIQIITLLRFQATGLANDEYDLMVISSAGKGARGTSLPGAATSLLDQQIPRHL
jgi:hypothetical protein